jgi:uncharacterized protein YyaL (SSP411 family)
MDNDFLQENKISKQDWNKLLGSSKNKLLKVRNERIPPGLDDKIITSWNAMTVTGLTDAYRALENPSFLDAAKKNMAFLEKELIKDKTIYRSYKGKASQTKGFLDDYAFVIQAYINLYQVTFEESYLEKAKGLMEFAIDNFFDKKEKFFFYTHDNTELITRKKEVFDNVIPSSNSVMARNLLFLGTIWDNNDWKNLSNEMTASLTELILSEPNYMSNWAIALLESKQPLAEVVFIGDDSPQLRREFQEQFHPFAITMGSKTESSLPLLEGKVTIEKKTTIYVCFNKTCKLPVHTIPEAIKQMDVAVMPNMKNGL